MNTKTARSPELAVEKKLELVQKIRASRAYSKAYEDMDFMRKKDLRPVRLQLELLKPEMILREHKIRSTIVVFGSARVISAHEAKEQLDECRKQAAAQPRSAALRRRLKRAQLRMEQSKYYE